MIAGRALAICWWGTVVLSLVGLGMATYLTVVHIGGHAPACGPVGDCDVVTTSRYAELLGIPVAALGVAMYGALLLGSLAVPALEGPPAILRHALLVVAGAGVGFSAYLTGIELFVLHAICAYCVASATLVVLIFKMMAVTAYLGRAPGLERRRGSDTAATG